MSDHDITILPPEYELPMKQNWYFDIFKDISWPAILRKWNKQWGKGSHGNRIDFFADGDEAYESMLQHIHGAKSRVWLETYIFDDSPIARRFVDALIHAKKKGCDVLLIIDWLGGFDIKKKWVEEMREAGIDVIFFNPLFPRQTGPFALRDHRKILITDNVAFCGSMNISKDAGGTKTGNNFFFDVQARLQGPCVHDVAEVVRDTLELSHTPITRPPAPPVPPICSCEGFASYNDSPLSLSSVPSLPTLPPPPAINLSFIEESRQKIFLSLSRATSLLEDSMMSRYERMRDTWRSLRPAGDDEGGKRRVTPSLHEGFFSPEEDKSDISDIGEILERRDKSVCQRCKDKSVYVQVLVSDSMRGRRDIQMAYCDLLEKARSEVLIASSYFLPPGSIRRSLLRAQARGAQVQLLLSGGSDIPGDMIATDYTLNRYLPYGVRVFRSLEHRHMHAKFCVVDKTFGVVGSFNLDRLSFRRNLEMVIAFYHKNTATKLAQIHQYGISNKALTKEYTWHQWKERNNVFVNFFNSLVHWGARTCGKNFFDGLSNQGRKVLFLNFLLDLRTPEYIASSMSFGLC